MITEVYVGGGALIVLTYIDMILLFQVIYGAAITDHTSAFTLAGLTDHWIHTGGPKKEGGRYHIPAVFFTPNTKISMLLQAVENASPSLVLTAELCGLYYSPIVSK